MPRTNHRLFALVCSLFLTLFIASPALAQSSEVKRLTQLGAQKYQAGDLDSAVAAYRQADALQPNNPDVLFGLAQALGDQGSLSEAEQIYLKLFPLYDQLQSHATQGGVFRLTSPPCEKILAMPTHCWT